MTPHAPPRSYHHGNLREVILELALAEVSANGLANLTLRKCAQAAGVNPAAVYRHFRNKASLVDHVRAAGFRRLADVMDDAIGELPARPARDAIAEAYGRVGLSYVRFCLGEPRLFEAMFRERLADEALHEASKGKSGRTPFDIQLDLTRRFVADLGGAGDVAQARELVEVYWSAIHGMATLTRSGHIDITVTEIDQRVDRLVAILVSGSEVKK